MPILGISSATKVISIGLIDDEKILIDQTVDDIHAEKIMHYVKEAGVEARQIEGVAVTQGPGSYSGLRGGLAAAKSLAQALNIPLVGIPTLDAIAYNRIGQDGKVAAILDARWDEVNFALFEISAGQLKRLTDDQVVKIGELDDRGAERETGHPYGVNVAKLGLLKLRDGQKDDPLTLIPHYSHKPHFKEYNT
jgi:tRNA threonylcarbamoyladenosine biosynthesis protein TsaB